MLPKSHETYTSLATVEDHVLERDGVERIEMPIRVQKNQWLFLRPWVSRTECAVVRPDGFFALTPADNIACVLNIDMQNMQNHYSDYVSQSSRGIRRPILGVLVKQSITATYVTKLRSVQCQLMDPTISLVYEVSMAAMARFDNWYAQQSNGCEESLTFEGEVMSSYLSCLRKTLASDS